MHTDVSTPREAYQLGVLLMADKVVQVVMVVQVVQVTTQVVAVVLGTRVAQVAVVDHT